MDPFSILLGLLSTGFNVSANRDAAYNAQVAAEMQANNERQNAAYADRAAKDAIDRGDFEASAQRFKTEQLEGTQRVATAGNGIDLSSGSAVNNIARTAFMGEMDAQTIRNNAAREAWGYQVQAAQHRTQAGYDILRGKYAQDASDWNTGASLLGSAAKVGAPVLQDVLGNYLSKNGG